MTKRKQIIVSLLGVLSAVFITIGITYSVFTYTKLGTTENTVTAGTLKFLYTENTGVGAGIALTDALPVSDTVGKSYSTEGKIFDFSIEATNSGTEVIPYEITLRKKNTSTLSDNAVKVYLTDMTEDVDSEILGPILYRDLAQTVVDVGDEVEKTIHTDSVAGGELTYLKNFRLRMWVAEETDFSSGDYNGKTFIATVNIYSNVPLVSEEEITLRNNADIKSLSTSDTTFTEVTNKEYQYETTLPKGTTETTINVETENPDSTVIIEKVDNLAYNNSNIERMSLSKTLPLTNGDNYFKVTIKSVDRKVINQYIINIKVMSTMDSSYSLAIGDAVTGIDGSKWHVLEASDSGTDTVVLLSDYNLNTDGSYNIECGVNINSTYECSARSFGARYYEDSSVKQFIENTYAPLVIKSLPNSTNITIPTAEQIALAVGKTFRYETLSLSNSWINTTNYWLYNAHKSTAIYHYAVYFSKNSNAVAIACSNYSDSGLHGVRPVIKTTKTNLVVE